MKGYISGFKLTGLRYFQKDDGGWQLTILDPRLKADIVNKAIAMLRQSPPATYMQIKKEIGNWYTRTQHQVMRNILKFATDEKLYDQIKLLEHKTEVHNSIIDGMYLDVAREMETQSSELFLEMKKN